MGFSDVRKGWQNYRFFQCVFLMFPFLQFPGQVLWPVGSGDLGTQYVISRSESVDPSTRSPLTVSRWRRYVLLRLTLPSSVFPKTCSCDRSYINFSTLSHCNITQVKWPSKSCWYPFLGGEIHLFLPGSWVSDRTDGHRTSTRTSTSKFGWGWGVGVRGRWFPWPRPFNSDPPRKSIAILIVRKHFVNSHGQWNDLWNIHV